LLEDVLGAQISSVKMVRSKDNAFVIKLKDSADITVENAVYYSDEWGQAPITLPPVTGAVADEGLCFPKKL
jgi:hypothetical protein